MSFACILCQRLLYLYYPGPAIMIKIFRSILQWLSIDILLI